MTLDPDFNPWNYLLLILKVIGSLVLVIVPASWAAIQVAQAIGGSGWVRSLVVQSADGVPLSAGEYILATAPVAAVLAVIFIALATLIASVIYAIVGPRRQRRKLTKRFEQELSEADRQKREELADAENRRREELADAENRRREELADAENQRREEVASAENERRDELAAAENRRREELAAAETRRLEEVAASEDRRRLECNILTNDYNEVVYRLKRLTEFLYAEIGHADREKPGVVIRSQSTTHDILANYDGRALEYYEIEAADEPVHFWKIWVPADAESDAVRTHGEIQLSAHFTIGDGSVIAAPTSNRPREKEFALFFNPPLAPGERRTLKPEYRWPGYWKQLEVERNVDYFTRATDRLGETARLELTFNFYGEARDVEARDLSVGASGATLTLQENHDMRAWRYSNPAWRVDGSEYRIKFSRPHGTAERSTTPG